MVKKSATRASSARWRHVAVIAILMGLIAYFAPARAAETVAYKLGIGDKIRVTVYDEKDLSGDFEVNDQGEIALPLLGLVKVQGLTVAEAEALFTKEYSKDYLVNPRITVEVLNYRPFFIIGEVRNPGSYPYMNGMTVVNAVALAGGYTPRANKNDIHIKRANDTNGKEVVVGEDAPVLPGDVLRVPERFF